MDFSKISAWGGKWIFAPDTLLKTDESLNAPEGAKWVWPEEYSCTCLKREISIDSAQSVHVQFVSDNAFDLIINGTEVFAGKRDIDEDLSEYFKTGVNLIVLRLYQAESTDQISVAISGSITAAAQKFVTDESWGAYVLSKQDIFPEALADACTEKCHLCCLDIHPKAYKHSILLRKPFYTDKRVSNATLMFSSAGEVEFTLNGKNVCDDLFVQSDFLKCKEYLSVDVTKHIIFGDNVLCAITGNSTLNSAGMGKMFMNKNMLLARLSIEYSDGTQLTVCTDTSWKCTLSPITDNDLQYGIRYDANREIPGWKEIEFDDSAWTNVDCGGMDTEIRPLIEKPYSSVKTVDELAPKTYTRYHGGFLLDFGGIYGGKYNLRLYNTKQNQKIKISFFQCLDDEHEPDFDVYGQNSDIECAKGVYRNNDVYICRGDKEEVFDPKFTFSVFRYVLVHGVSDRDSFDLNIKIMHNALPESGSIGCDYKPVDNIAHACERAIKNNLFNGITDSVFDRSTYSETAATVGEALCYCFNANSLLSSWTKYGRKVSESFEIYSVPLMLYDFYRNKSILKDRYNDILAYAYSIDFNLVAQTRAKGKGIRAEKKFFEHCFYCDMLIKVQRIAEILEDYKTADKFKDMAIKSVKSFNEFYYLPDEDDYILRTQEGIILPLAFNLAPRNCDKALAKHLNEYVLLKGHLDCGNIALKYVFDVLCDYGFENTAYKMFIREKAPSLQSLVTDNSLNNSFAPTGRYFDASNVKSASILAWMYKYLGGIRPCSPGFAHVVLQPMFIRQLGAFSCNYDSVCGKISSSWKFDENTVTYTFAAEENITLILPDMSSRDYPAGEHKIKIKF